MTKTKKPSVYKTLFLDLLDKSPQTIVLPNSPFKIYYSDDDMVTFSLPHHKSENDIFGKYDGRKLRMLCFTITHDPYTQYASHCISLGYFNYRLTLMKLNKEGNTIPSIDCKVCDDGLYFTTHKSNLDIKHMRPDR